MDEQAAPQVPEGPAASSDIASSPPSSLSWLNHSQHSLTHSLSPDNEHKPVARQKRRRTSPEDQKILEAEYQRNPKPDKTARLEIVQQVALGEKEVQIWFQNRRQNSRRKIRPLLAHEVIPHLRSSFSDSAIDCSHLALRLDEASRSEDEGREMLSRRQGKHAGPESADACTSTSEAPAHDLGTCSTNPLQSEPAADEQSLDTDPATNGQHCISSTPVIAITTTKSPLPSSQETLPPPHPVSLRYLADRRSAFFRDEDAAMGTPPLTAQATLPNPASRTLNRSRSGIRLSLTADGKAKIITAEENSLIPEPQDLDGEPRIRGALTRSISVLSPDEVVRLDGKVSLSSAKLRRTLSGRSRDSRAWEFWCDSSSRNSLAEKAEQESSGSAADAIGLIRANNNKGALRQNSNKRNAQILANHPNTKRVKTEFGNPKKPQLKRVSSSYGRLQSKPSCTSEDIVTKSKKSDSPEILEMPQTESDKENWEPAGQSGLRAPTASQDSGRPARKVLGERGSATGPGRTLGTMAREKYANHTSSSERRDGDISSPEADEEIAKCMGSPRRESTRTSVSSGEDLDCIEGLLKLSQGNWK